MPSNIDNKPTRLFDVVLLEQQRVLARIRSELHSAEERLAFIEDLEKQWAATDLPPPVKVGLRSHPSVVLAKGPTYEEVLLMANEAQALPLVVELRGQAPTRPASPKPPTSRITPAVLASPPYAVIGAELFASRRTYCMPDMLYHYLINTNHVLTCEHSNHGTIHDWSMVFWVRLADGLVVRVTAPLTGAPKDGLGVTPHPRYNQVILHTWGEGSGCYTYFYETPAT